MAIYNGTQNINMSGIGKVYVGTQLVYQKQATPEWHTIYTGSQAYNTASTATFSWNPGIVEASEYKFRISGTVSSSATNGGSGGSVSGNTNNPTTSLYNNSSSDSGVGGSKIVTDFEFDACTTSVQFYLINAYASQTYGRSASLSLYFDNTTATKTFKITSSTGRGDASCSMTITKVEQYY